MICFFGILLGVVGLFLPASMKVSQYVQIQAPQAKVFELVNNLSLQESWSPWKELDPTMTNSFSGPKRGVGAKMSWESSNSGNGSMEITEVVPGHVIQLALDFGPMGKAHSSWNFLPSSSQGANEKQLVAKSTRVQWGFVSAKTNNPIARIANLLIKPSLEKTYAQGLANLKKVAEDKKL